MSFSSASESGSGRGTREHLRRRKARRENSALSAPTRSIVLRAIGAFAALSMLLIAVTPAGAHAQTEPEAPPETEAPTVPPPPLPADTTTESVPAEPEPTPTPEEPDPSPTPEPVEPTAPAPTPPAPGTPASTLILYDKGGEWGWLGEQYAAATGNLVSHFGSYSAKPITEYAAGEMFAYDAAVYIGSSWDEPIPTAFLDDTLTAQTHVIWMNWNIWQLTNHVEDFQDRYGWKDGYLDVGEISQVTYKGKSFTRNASYAGVMDYSYFDTGIATVKAEAVRSDGTSFPWAVHSGNLTYVGEIPFVYMSETDRYVAFSDLLFDVLAPSTPERHRALVRLEDVGCDSDPTQLRAIADYLKSRRVPFSFGVFPVYKDPLGTYHGGVSTTVSMSSPQCAQVVSAIKYMILKGGRMIMHGYTHQLDGLINPYDMVSGNDFEFFTAHIDETDHVVYDGPVAGDSYTWALKRIKAGKTEFKKSGLPNPTIFEFPHYAASAEDYRAAASQFRTRYERGLYFSGVLSGQAVDHTKMMGQFFPYVVSDVYGSKVLPENIGNVEPESFNHHPVTMPADLVARAQLNLAVRDGYASFFYHPHLGLDYLRQTVEGIQGLGYKFVNPATL